MKILDKIIKSNVISLIIVTIILILMTVFITSKYIESKFKNTYVVDNFVVNTDRKIKTKLEKLSDEEGLKTKEYDINITNNGIKRNYKILLSPIIDNDDQIRVSFNNNTIRNLSSFDKEDNSYVIYKYYLPTSYSSLNNIKIWQKQDSNLNNINVDFKIEFKID